jgi:predicted deacylase
VRKVKLQQFLMVFILLSICFVASTSFVSAANNTTIHAANSTFSASNAPADTTPPVTTITNPGKNALNVPVNQHIKITYNEPVKLESGWIELRNGDGQLIPITKSISGNTLTVISKSLLNMSTTYTVSVHTKSISDLAGNGIAVNSFKFTTAIRIDIINTKTGGDITQNSVLYHNIPKTVLSTQIISKAKTGTPMVTFGDGNGPKILIVAGVHGNELPAPAAAMKLINYLNGKTIHGTIYIIPFAIPYNSAHIQRYWNGKNPNEVANVYGTPTNIIVNLAMKLHVNALGDFHSSQPGGVPGKDAIFCTKAPTYKSYQIASYISKKTVTSLITYKTAGAEYPGALEDVCNQHGIPAVTCEVLETHGTITSTKLNKSYSEMIALLTYYGMI